MTWIITDTHFWHHNIIKYCDRPKDHNERMIQAWCDMVQPEDEIIHLGDVIFGSKKSGLVDLLASLPGIKHHIRGNHDKKSPDYYVDSGFTTSANFFVRDQIYFSHRPEQVLRPGCKINIHGHVHNAQPREYHYFPKSVALIIEYEDYKPVDLEEFMARDYVKEIL